MITSCFDTESFWKRRKIGWCYRSVN